MKIICSFLTVVFFFSFFSTAKASGSPSDKKFESDLESRGPTVSLLLSSSKPYILVVDDNALNRKCLRKIFEKNYEIVEAENGMQAIQACIEYTFLFITMDWEMPILSGPEAIQRIRQELRLNIPIFAITSCIEQHHRDTLMHAGVQDIFPKPFRKEHLLKLVEVVKSQQ